MGETDRETRRPRGGGARWALMAVTLVLGLALLASSVASFLSVRRASDAVTAHRAAQLARDLLWPLVAEDPESIEAALASSLEDFAAEGLRYVAIVDGDAAPLVEAGERQDLPVSLPPRRPPRPPGEFLDLEAIGPIVRVAVPVGRPGHRGRAGPRFLERFRRGLGFGPDRRWFVFEFEPLQARDLRSRAARNLVASLSSAIILLLAAAWASRLSARSEAYREQLARDRQLKALGEMSAVLGHELRNPLASLKGHAQLLVERLGTADPTRGGAETIVAEATRLEQLTGQILDFAKTRAIERREEDLPALLEAAIERARVGRVERSLDERVGRWSVDRPRLERVLENLLLNARQNSNEEDPIDVTIRREGPSVSIEVRDRGPGIEPGDEERIFEPFVTNRVRGTGLGLALARQIVEGHGGAIHARNHPEGGAVFQVVLPE